MSSLPLYKGGVRACVRSYMLLVSRVCFMFTHIFKSALKCQTCCPGYRLVCYGTQSVRGTPGPFHSLSSFHVLQILIQLFYLNFLCEAMFYTVSAPLNKASSAFPPSCSLSFQSTSRAIEDTQLMISVSLCLRVSYFHVHGLHQLSLAAMTGIILIDTSPSYRPTLSPSHPQHPYHLRVYRS